MDKPLSHQVRVVRIKEVLPHNNADKLEIIPIEGFQAVVRKGDYKVGDLAYYIQPDSVVPVRPEFAFLWQDKVIPGEDVPQKYRRISARRLRKEWSEGLLMPFSQELVSKVQPDIIEGMDISDLLGIEHYQPPEPFSHGQNERGPKSAYPKSFKGWVYWVWWRFIGLFGFSSPSQGFNERGPKFDKPYYDVENFKNHVSAFVPGEEVVVTEKIHGCQGKYVYQDGHMYAGSRNFWKSAKSACIWRKCLAANPWIEEWCRKNEGFTLYGEVIPCQGENFMYGFKPGELGFMVFDILTPAHEWISYQDVSRNTVVDIAMMFWHWVPVMYRGPFDMDIIKKECEGKSYVSGQKIKEGGVIKPVVERDVRGLGRLKLKLINNEYLERN